MTNVTGIALKSVSLTLDQHRVFDELCVQFTAGRWHSILGRSGIGKSSLLRLIAGLQAPDSGTLHSEPRTALASGVAYMAQDDGLLPWLTTRQNIQLGPRLRGEALQRTDERVNELIEQMGLSAWAEALPAALSGGMRQRVALARTLLEERPIVLMDEPFSRLDAITRDELQTLAFQRLTDRTVLLVTHDPMEALRLSHELHVLEPGAPSTLHSIKLKAEPPRPLDHAAVLKHLPEVWQLMKFGLSPTACV